MKRIRQTLALLSIGFVLTTQTGCDAVLGALSPTEKTTLNEPSENGNNTSTDNNNTSSNNDSNNNNNSSNDGSSNNSNSGNNNSSDNNSSSNNNSSNSSSVFDQFLGNGENYFGPSDSQLSLSSGLSGNDAAGSRRGGPDNEVGVLVTVESGNKAYMQVVNLRLTERQYLVEDGTGRAFSVNADVLNSKPFPSLFVTSIPSLTTVKFEHRTSPNPPKCSYYTATFSGTVSNGKYIASKTGSGSCTHG